MTKGGVIMSKSKKNNQSKDQKQLSNAQNCENNMKYSTDKQQGSASDCDNCSENKNESNCR